MLAISAVFVKFISEYFDPIEVIFFRNLIALGMLIIGYFIFRQNLTLKTNRPWHQLLRAAIGTTAVIIGVWTISILPLAEMTVLFFTSPLFVIPLSIIFLKEKIGVTRIIAVFLGFSGIWIMAGLTLPPKVGPC